MPAVAAFTAFALQQSNVENNIQKVLTLQVTLVAAITPQTVFWLQFPATVGTGQPTEIPCGTIAAPTADYDPGLYCNYDVTN